jgi:hypothetical protein
MQKDETKWEEGIIGKQGNNDSRISHQILLDLGHLKKKKEAI